MVKFESITKPEREAQNDHLEHTTFILSRRLQRFSKRAHEICYKTVDLWGRRFTMANPLDKNRVLENTCAPNLKESTILNEKRSKCERGVGSSIKPWETLHF